MPRKPAQNTFYKICTSWIVVLKELIRKIIVKNVYVPGNI